VIISITGSSGFVGQNLQKYLAFSNVNVVTILKNELATISGNNVRIGNIIIHLAGKAHDLKNVSQPEEYYQINYELTKKLYDVFLNSEAKKFIFISTVKAVADNINESLREDHKPNPRTHYGKSKRLAEEYILNQRLPTGKSFYILRPCMIHGTNNKGNLNLLFNFISKGLPWPLGAFENQRSFCSIENLCFIIKELIEVQCIPSGVYNVADDEVLSTREIIKIISNLKNKRPRIWNIPEKYIKLFAKLGDYLHLPINSDRLQKLTENYIVSNVKIKQALGKKLPVSAREGLIKTFKSFSNRD
jgi:nucleoside-diphosphate-sugar epimerase